MICAYCGKPIIALDIRMRKYHPGTCRKKGILKKLKDKYRDNPEFRQKRKAYAKSYFMTWKEAMIRKFREPKQPKLV